MKFFDLTHTIAEDMPVYPGTEKPTLFPANSYEKDGFRETKLCMFSHTGTHIDPPAHLFPEKETLEEFPVSQFIGRALVVDCSAFNEGEQIPLKHLLNYGEKINEVDFLLFRFGWDSKWGTCDYFGNYPCLSLDLLDYIIAGNYKGIGLDVISLDPISDFSLTRHKRLFANKKMINIENLCNLHHFIDCVFMFSCFPIKVENSDGAPCRAVGWFVGEHEGVDDGF